MPRALNKSKNRNPKSRVFALHHVVAYHQAWARLSPYAKVLWLEFGLEYNTANNGWLACPYKYLLAERGFKSRSTISKSLDELLRTGFLLQTYPGGIKECARYALTHLDIIAVNSNPARKAPHTYREISDVSSQEKINPTGPPLDIKGPPRGPKTAIFTSSKGSLGPLAGLGNDDKKSKKTEETQGMQGDSA